MIGSTMTAEPTIPAFINGVSLHRRDGQPRHNFSPRERLAILGGDENDLDAFGRVFARRRSPYIVRRSKSGTASEWVTSQGSLTNDLIVRHLLTDRLPRPAILWVGTRAWETTRYVVIDVDFKQTLEEGDDSGRRKDFDDRCRRLEEALYRLGIPRSHWLLQDTPSGGRHYYFFLYDPIPTSDIRPVFELVGLTHEPGRFEFYPAENQGVRLPFGYVPGKPHDPDAWLRFIRAYESGEFPRANWQACRRRAEGCAIRRWDAELPQESGIDIQPGPIRRGKKEQSHGRAPGPKTPVGAPKEDQLVTERYLELLHKRSLSPADIRELMDCGIRREGTRRVATNRVAWHLLAVRGLLEEEVVNIVTEWVYRTGRHTSKDVQADLASGIRTVALDIRRLVGWLIEKRKCRVPQGDGKYRFAVKEVDAIVEKLRTLSEGLRQERLQFALDFLNFAKQWGKRSPPDGWLCSPSVRGIIQGWKGCSGMRYKAHVDWAIDVRLIEKVREKRQTANGTGRARTYLFQVPIVEPEEAMFTFATALAYARQKLSQSGTVLKPTAGASLRSDTYDGIGGVVCPERGSGSSKASESGIGAETKVEHQERLMQVVTDRSKEDDTCSGRSIEDAASNNRNPGSNRDLAHSRGQSLPGSAECQHTPSPDKGVVQSPAECLGIRRDVFSGVSHQALGREPPAADGGKSDDNLVRRALDDPACPNRIRWLLETDPCNLDRPNAARRKTLLQRLRTDALTSGCHSSLHAAVAPVQSSSREPGKTQRMLSAPTYRTHHKLLLLMDSDDRPPVDRTVQQSALAMHGNLPTARAP